MDLVEKSAKARILGQNIRRERIRAGLSQRDLSYISGVSLAVISNIETGVTKDPGVFTVVRLVDALKVPLSSVVSGC